MPDFALIQGAITSLKAAGDIAKGFLELKSIADVQGKVIELQSTILSAQQSAIAAQSEQASMIEHIRELEKEISDVKAWEKTKQRYQLREPTPGTFVYAMKEQSENPEPVHWICTNCYEGGRRSILQLKIQTMDGDHYVCSNCNAQIKVRNRGHRPFA